jgi:hypothetical protein
MSKPVVVDFAALLDDPEAFTGSQAREEELRLRSRTVQRAHDDAMSVVTRWAVLSAAAVAGTDRRSTRPYAAPPNQDNVVLELLQRAAHEADDLFHVELSELARKVVQRLFLRQYLSFLPDRQRSKAEAETTPVELTSALLDLAWFLMQRPMVLPCPASVLVSETGEDSEVDSVLVSQTPVMLTREQENQRMHSKSFRARMSRTSPLQQPSSLRPPKMHPRWLTLTRKAVSELRHAAYEQRPGSDMFSRARWVSPTPVRRLMVLAREAFEAEERRTGRAPQWIEILAAALRDVAFQQSLMPWPRLQSLLPQAIFQQRVRALAWRHARRVRLLRHRARLRMQMRTEWQKAREILQRVSWGAAYRPESDEKDERSATRATVFRRQIAAASSAARPKDTKEMDPIVAGRPFSYDFSQIAVAGPAAWGLLLGRQRATHRYRRLWPPSQVYHLWPESSHPTAERRAEVLLNAVRGRNMRESPWIRDCSALEALSMVVSSVPVHMPPAASALEEGPLEVTQALRRAVADSSTHIPALVGLPKSLQRASTEAELLAIRHGFTTMRGHTPGSEDGGFPTVSDPVPPPPPVDPLHAPGIPAHGKDIGLRGPMYIDMMNLDFGHRRPLPTLNFRGFDSSLTEPLLQSLLQLNRDGTPPRRADGTIGGALRVVRSINLSGCRALSGQLLLPVVLTCPCLTSLNLRGCIALGPTFFSGLLADWYFETRAAARDWAIGAGSGSPKRRLEMSGQGALPPRARSTTLRHVLRDLDVTDCPGVTPAFCLQVPRRMTALESIRFTRAGSGNGSTALKDGTIDEFSSRPSTHARLTALDLGQCRLVSDEAMVGLFSAMHGSLRKLSLAGMKQLTSLAFTGLPQAPKASSEPVVAEAVVVAEDDEDAEFGKLVQGPRTGFSEDYESIRQRMHRRRRRPSLTSGKLLGTDADTEAALAATEGKGLHKSATIPHAVSRRAAVALIQLDLSDTRLGDSALELVGGTCQRLLRISLQRCPRIGATGLAALMRGCTNLTALNLTDSQQIGDTVISAMVNACTPSRLRAERATFLSATAAMASTANQDWVKAVGFACPLSEVRLTGCFRVTDDGVATLCRRFGASLTLLDLSGCPSVGDASMESIAAHCFGLERLRLAGRLNLEQRPSSADQEARGRRRHQDDDATRHVMLIRRTVDDDGNLIASDDEEDDDELQRAMAALDDDEDDDGVVRLDGIEDEERDVALSKRRRAPKKRQQTMFGRPRVTGKGLRRLFESHALRASLKALDLRALVHLYDSDFVRMFPLESEIDAAREKERRRRRRMFRKMERVHLRRMRGEDGKTEADEELEEDDSSDAASSASGITENSLQEDPRRVAPAYFDNPIDAFILRPGGDALSRDLFGRTSGDARVGRPGDALDPEWLGEYGGVHRYEVVSWKRIEADEHAEAVARQAELDALYRVPAGLETLNIRGCHIGPKGLARLNQWLTEQRKLTRRASANREELPAGLDPEGGPDDSWDGFMLEDEALAAVGGKAKRLRIGRRRTAVAAMDVPPFTPAFKRLMLSNCTSLDDERLLELACSAPYLEMLTMDGSDSVTSAGVAALAIRCGNLRAVSMCRVRGLTDDGIAAMAKFCPLLERVRIKDCPGVTQGSLIRAAKLLPRVWLGLEASLQTGHSLEAVDAPKHDEMPESKISDTEVAMTTLKAPLERPWSVSNVAPLSSRTMSELSTARSSVRLLPPIELDESDPEARLTPRLDADPAVVVDEDSAVPMHAVREAWVEGATEARLMRSEGVTEARLVRSASDKLKPLEHGPLGGSARLPSRLTGTEMFQAASRRLHQALDQLATFTEQQEREKAKAVERAIQASNQAVISAMLEDETKHGKLARPLPSPSRKALVQALQEAVKAAAVLPSADNLGPSVLTSITPERGLFPTLPLIHECLMRRAEEMRAASILQHNLKQYRRRCMVVRAQRAVITAVTERLRAGALAFQRVWRVHYARMLLHRAREHHVMHLSKRRMAAWKLLQRWWRGCLGREVARRIRLARLLRLYHSWRRFIRAYNLMASDRPSDAVTTIACAWRQRVARGVANARRNAACSITRSSKSAVVRRRLLRAVPTVQVVARARLRVAKFCQAHWRGVVARRLVAQRLADRLRATVLFQLAWRSHAQRGLARSKRARWLHAFCLAGAAARGCVARAQFQRVHVRERFLETPPLLVRVGRPDTDTVEVTGARRRCIFHRGFVLRVLERRAIAAAGCQKILRLYRIFRFKSLLWHRHFNRILDQFRRNRAAKKIQAQWRAHFDRRIVHEAQRRSRIARRVGAVARGFLTRRRHARAVKEALRAEAEERASATSKWLVTWNQNLESGAAVVIRRWWRALIGPHLALRRWHRKRDRYARIIQNAMRTFTWRKWFRWAKTRRAVAAAKLASWWRRNRVMRKWRQLFRNKAGLRALAQRHLRAAHRVTERLEARWQFELKQQEAVALMLQRKYKSRRARRFGPTWRARAKLFSQLQGAKRQRLVFLATCEAQELVPFRAARAYLVPDREDIVTKAQRRLRVDVRALARAVVAGNKAQASEADDAIRAASMRVGALDVLRKNLEQVRTKGSPGDDLRALLAETAEEKRLRAMVDAAGGGTWGVGPFAGLKRFGGAVMSLVQGGLTARSQSQKRGLSFARRMAEGGTNDRPWSTEGDLGVADSDEDYDDEDEDEDEEVGELPTVGAVPVSARVKEKMKSAERARRAASRRARRRLRSRLIGEDVDSEAMALSARLLFSYESARATSILSRRAELLGWTARGVMQQVAKRDAMADRAAAMVGSNAKDRTAATVAAERVLEAGGGGKDMASSVVVAAAAAGALSSRRDDGAIDWEADATQRSWMGGRRTGGLYPAHDAEARLVQVALGLATVKGIRGAPGNFGVEGWSFSRAVAVRPDEGELTEADISIRKRMKDLDWERAAGYHMSHMLQEEVKITQREIRNLERDMETMQARCVDLEDALVGFRHTADELAALVTDHEAANLKNDDAQEQVLRAIEYFVDQAQRSCDENGGVIGRFELLPLIHELLTAAGMEEEV